MYEEPEKVNPTEIEDKGKDPLMEQLNDYRIEQKITPEQLIPEIKKQKQDFFIKHQKPLFLLFLVTALINMAGFIVLLFF